MLASEWAGLTDSERRERYLDYCLVNEVICHTVDAVQDQVLEPAMPIMDVIDKMFGPMDEMIISRLITQWRETVWQYAMGLLEIGEPSERLRLILQVEEYAIRQAGAIRLNDWRAIVSDLLKVA